MTASDSIETSLGQLPRSRRWSPLVDAVEETLRLGDTAALEYAAMLVQIDASERRLAREIVGVAMARATFAIAATAAILPSAVATLRGDQAIAASMPATLLGWRLDAATPGQIAAAVAGIVLVGTVAGAVAMCAAAMSSTGRRSWVDAVSAGWLAVAVDAGVPLGRALRQAAEIADGPGTHRRWADVAEAIDRGSTFLQLPPVDPFFNESIQRLAGGREPHRQVTAELADWAWRRRIELRVAGRGTLRRIVAVASAALTAGLLTLFGWAMLMPIVRGLQTMTAP